MPTTEAKDRMGSPLAFEWWVGLSNQPRPAKQVTPENIKGSLESTESITSTTDKSGPLRRYIGKRPSHEKWPTAFENENPPILYAHFCIKRDVMHAPETFMFLPAEPKLTPDMLIYFGERSNVSNFKYGPLYYPWLNEVRNCLIYSLYWPVWNGKVDEYGGTLDWRRTLESQIYFALKDKYHSSSNIFQYVSGLQFRHRFMKDKDLIDCRDFVLNDIIKRFESCSA